MATIDDYSVSILLMAPPKESYPGAEFVQTVESALAIDHPKKEILILENQGESAVPALGKLGPRVKRVKGKFATRAARYNAGLKASAGDFIWFVPSDTAPFL